MANNTRTPLYFPRGVPSGAILLAASSNKCLHGSTYVDLLAASVYISKRVGTVGVMVISTATLYGLYCTKASAATLMRRIRLMNATSGNTFGKNTMGFSNIAATQGEALNFSLGAPFTPLGATSGNKRLELLRQLIVWEEN
jgi:hypothetical protein